MGALLESGLVGNIGLKHLKVIKEDTINKWDKLGFLEGLKGHLKENVAQLYENQASYLINEAASTADSGSFETVVFPIVRRVFSKLLANDIVSVQAMNLPIGKLFYFVPNIQSYETETSTFGEHWAPYGSPNAAANQQPNSGYDYNATKDLYDRFYEGNEPALDPPGLYDYSKGSFSSITAGNATVVWVGDELVASGYGLDNYRKVLLVMTGFASAGAGQLIGPNGQPMDTEEFLSDLTIRGAAANYTTAANVNNNYLFRVVTQRYGKGIVEYGSDVTLEFPNSKTDGGTYYNVCDAEGKIYLEVDLQVPVCISCGDANSIDGYTGSTFYSSLSAASQAFTTTYRIYKNLEFEDRIGEVSFDLQSVTVSVTERKLRAQWSPEMAQDVAAFHNIDAEAELTALLSEQVAAEIDREILRDLRKGAAWNLRWDYNGWKRLGSSAVPYTQKDWNQTLITAINQISAQIHKSTLRGGANWIVVSSEVSAIFDDLEYFHVSNAAPEQDQYNMGIERVGTLAGRYQVYRDPYFPANQVLLGHKGTSLLDTGYIYAPYVPLQLTPTMYNPFNFTPIKGIMTRYAKKMVNNRFYGRITVDGVRTFDLRELR
jgi:Major capsid protein Gp23